MKEGGEKKKRKKKEAVKKAVVCVEGDNLATLNRYR